MLLRYPPTSPSKVIAKCAPPDSLARVFIVFCRLEECQPSGSTGNIVECRQILLVRLVEQIARADDVDRNAGFLNDPSDLIVVRVG